MDNVLLSESALKHIFRQKGWLHFLCDNNGMILTKKTYLCGTTAKKIISCQKSINNKYLLSIAVIIRTINQYITS